jgi:RNA polymerase sigma-70 factor (ECF subfamily)
VELQQDRRVTVTPSGTPSALDDAAERELLQRTAARDRDAFKTLYLAYHRRLARFLVRMTRQYDVAEEIINDTLWVVWQRAGDFRGSSRVSTWIMGIAYRRALKTLRRANLQSRWVELDADVDYSDYGATVDSADRRELVARALAQLPLEQRLVLEFTYYLGHSCAEIAEIMECPVNTVKTRMFHARRKLRTLMPALSGAGAEE